MENARSLSLSLGRGGGASGWAVCVDVDFAEVVLPL